MQISIAMCTYNGAKYLREQLESMINQSLPPSEIVICDDGSTDHTLKIIESFRMKTMVPVAVYTNEKPLGVARNFARAISLCRSPYIAIADQDDVWMSNKLEVQKNYLDQHTQIDVVFSNLERVDENLRPMQESMWDFMKFNSRMKSMWQKGFERLVINRIGNVATGCSMMIRKKFGEVIVSPIEKGYFPGFIHDQVICLVAISTHSIAFIDQKLGKYRQHQGQVVGTRVSTQQGSPQLFQKDNIFVGLIEGLKMEYDALLSINRTSGDLYILERLIDHAHFRMGLPKHSIKRFLRVVSAYLIGNYRYSRGLLSAMKDILVARA